MNVIIIPSLNPNKNLIKLVKGLQKLELNNILVIDDGSGKEYSHYFDEAKELGCIVIKHKKNMGKGQAIKTGIKRADKYFKNINGYIIADSDGQHSPKDISRVDKELKDDIVLGIRNFDLENVPFKSKYGNKFSSIAFKLLTGVTCHDTQTGLRGIPKKYKDFALSTKGSRFDYEMNFLVESVRNDVKIKEIKIETIYENKNKGSHFKVFKDSFRIYRNYIKELLICILLLIVVVVSIISVISVIVK